MRGATRREALRVGIWGCGRAGSAFARAIAARRGEVRLARLLSRSRRKAAAIARGIPGAAASAGPSDLAARCDAILLCVPDDALPVVADRLAEAGSLKGCSVLHLSGGIGAGVLAPARRAGASAGTLHPLVPLASGRLAAGMLTGAWFAAGGSGKALEAARRIVAHLDGSVLGVPTGARPAYHLAATIIANHATILAALALDRLGEEGLSGTRVRAAFSSLLRAAARNIEEMGPVEALTGPASRADLATLLRHLELLEGGPAGLDRLYRLLSECGLEIAVRRGDLSRARASSVIRSLRVRRPGR